MENRLLTVLAVVLVVLSLLALSVTLTKTADFKQRVTGYASGYVNVTIITTLALSVSPDTIEFGAGAVDAGQGSATLYTQGANATSIVTDGNWSTTAAAIQIINTGNINSSLNITSSQAAADFIGGTSPVYEWKVTDAEVGSCTGGLVGSFQTVVKDGAHVFCDQFSALTASNRVYLDAKITIPNDAVTTTTTITDTLTITAEAAI